MRDLGGGAMNLLYRLWLAWMDRKDSALRLQTPIQKYDGFDESKAVAAAKRALLEAERRRSIALARGGQLQPARGLRKVERIDDRRQA